MSRSKLALIGALVFGAVILAACGKPTDPPAMPPSEPARPPAEPAPVPTPPDDATPTTGAPSGPIAPEEGVAPNQPPPTLPGDEPRTTPPKY